MIQTVSYRELDNMFFETLRRAVVAAGYLPDIANYQSGSPSVNAAAYKAAKATLRATTMLTEVFNTGSFESKGEKTINKIVIVRGNKIAGSIGGWPATQIDLSTPLPKDADSRFTKSFLPDNSNSIEYHIKLITNDSVWDNALSSIIDNVIPQKRFLNTVDSTGNYTTKMVLVLGMGDMNISAFNFMERTYKVRVSDVFLQSPIALKGNIPVMSTVEYYVFGNPDYTTVLDGETISTVGGTPAPTPPYVGQYDFASIIAWIVTSPNPTNVYTLPNGDRIRKEYAPASTLTILTEAGEPYLTNALIKVLPAIFVVDNVNFQDEPFDPETGSFDHSAFGGFSPDNNPGVVSFNISLPMT